MKAAHTVCHREREDGEDLVWHSGQCAPLGEPPNGRPTSSTGFNVLAEKQFIPVIWEWDQIEARLDDMQRCNWADELSMELDVTIVTFCGSSGALTLTQIRFLISNSGFWQSKLHFETQELMPYQTDMDFRRLLVEIVVILFALKQLFEEVEQAVEAFRASKEHDVSGRGDILAHFRDFWNVIDALSITLILSSMVIWMQNCVLCSEFLHRGEADSIWQYVSFLDLLAPHAHGGLIQLQAAKFVNDEDVQQLGTGWSIQVGISEFMAFMSKAHLLYREVNALNIVLTTARIIKETKFQPRLAMIINSLEEASQDFLHFLLVFLFITGGYAVAGNVAFGNTMEEFVTLSASFQASFELMLGEFDYKRMENASSKLVATAYFWSYMIIVTLVGMNFFVGIFVDAFSKVKDKTSPTIDTMAEEFAKGANRRARKLLYMAKDPFKHLTGHDDYISWEDFQKLIASKAPELLEKKDISLPDLEELLRANGKPPEAAAYFMGQCEDDIEVTKEKSAEERAEAEAQEKREAKIDNLGERLVDLESQGSEMKQQLGEILKLLQQARIER